MPDIGEIVHQIDSTNLISKSKQKIKIRESIFLSVPAAWAYTHILKKLIG
jgi:hypothetical protein